MCEKKEEKNATFLTFCRVDAILLINICAGVPAGTAVRWTVLPFSPLFTARHVIESRLKMSRLLLLFWVCLLPFFYRFLLMNESILGVILFPGGGFRILYWQFYYLWQWERIDFRLRVNSLRDAGKKNVRKQVIWAFLVLIFLSVRKRWKVFETKWFDFPIPPAHENSKVHLNRSLMAALSSATL